MTEHASPVPGRERVEPVAVTLIDLAALVVGVAIAVTLDIRFWNKIGESNPRWLSYLRHATWTLDDGCLALTPVILARRAVYGGLARPFEFLVACCGMIPLLRGVDLSLISWWIRFRHNAPTAFMEWTNGLIWHWYHLLLGASILAAVVSYSGRHRLPGWLLSALMMFAWGGLFWTGPNQVNWGVGRAMSSFLDLSNAASSLVMIPQYAYDVAGSLLYALPTVIALGDLRRPVHPRRNWVEWIGMGLVASLFLITETGNAISTYASGIKWRMNWAWELRTHTLNTLLGLALGWLIARRLGLLWRR